jgi:hypothetical protein
MIPKGKRSQTLRVFLSYAAADRAYAHQVRSLLSQRPDVYVFTTETLSAGENWQAKLKDELSRCDLFVVLFSPNSLESKWVLHELGAAWAIGKPIIPIVTHPEVSAQIPVALSQEQLVEMKDLGKPEVMNRILERYEETEASP